MLHGEQRDGRGNGSCRGLSIITAGLLTSADLRRFLALSLPFPD
jgi:hypothetical protein